MAVVVVAVPIVFVEPLLIVALELVVEGDPLDARATLPQTRLGAFIAAIDLDVVPHLARAFEARVERLAVLLVTVSVALQQAAAFFREHDRMVAMTGHPDGLDQSLLAEMAQVARTGIGRPAV